MKTRALTALAASLLVTAAWAQSANQPLNLKLPQNSTSSSSSNSKSTQPASASTPQPTPSAVTINGARPTPAPGVYYGDTSGRRGSDTAAAPVCDDSTY